MGQAERRIKRSVNLDPDMVIWIQRKAAAASTSENTIVRQVIRAAMNAEYVASGADADVEQ